MSETWHAYEDAILATMGCSDASFKGGRGTTYRLLLQPTFHRPSCVAISIEESAAEAQIVVLKGSCFDLFDAALKRDPRLLDRDFLALRECSCDVTELPLARAERLLAQLGELHLDTLSDMDFGARDGIVIRFDRLGAEGSLVVRMSSPTRGESPRHHRLVREILAVAQEVFPAFGGEIEIISSYLVPSAVPGDGKRRR
jgi:hypothetical protein